MSSDPPETDLEPTSSCFYPDDATFAAQFHAAMQESVGAVEIISREPNYYSSTYPSEIVRCRLPDGSQRLVLCKHNRIPHPDPPGERDSRYGIVYETQVYRHVLRNLPLTRPEFYGGYADPTSEAAFLVIEWADEGTPLHYTDEDMVVPPAADWCGRFHHYYERRGAGGELAFLRRYDADYYRGWAHRIQEMAARQSLSPAWLPEVCRRYEEHIPLLLQAPQIVIHGEYTPSNVVWHGGRILPTDWESAAVGPGEIDLATLIFEWEEIVEVCTSRYCAARWPEGTPEGFADMMRAAQLYVAMHWLSDGSPGNRAKKSMGFLDELRVTAERLGLL